MKNPLFDNFKTLQEQNDAYALFIGEMMKPGKNDKVKIQELEEQNDAMMDEVDVVQAKHDNLVRRRTSLLKNLEEKSRVNDRLNTIVDDLREQIQCNTLDMERAHKDVKHWYNMTIRLSVFTAVTTFVMILALLPT